MHNQLHYVAMFFFTYFFFRCKCLDDIKASFLFGYPDELVFKLYERKGRCFMSLERPNEAATCFEEALNKGGLISESFSISFHPQKNPKITVPQLFTFC